jgi:EmrB/QacA subfamily drug resistance transporter
MISRLREQAAARAEKPYYKWVVLGTVMFALLIILLDVTIVNVSIPSILKDFDTDIASVQWVFNAYTLAFAALLITFGRLGDMWGHKRMFMLGLATFGIASILSGASPSIEWLIIFRALQGIGGAMMMPATLSLMLQVFPAHQRGLALGLWGAMAGVALAIGPTLGGFITDNYSWRWIFYINVPVCLLALGLTTVFIHQSREGLLKHRLDMPGFVSVTGGLLALTYALIEGQKYGWGSFRIVSLLVVSVVLFGIFVVVERRQAEPLVDLKLFRDPNFTVGNVVALMITFSMLGTFFLIPLFLQQVLGFSAIKTGLAVTPLSLAMLFVSPVVGRLSDRIDGRLFMGVGLVIVSGALVWLSHFSTSTTSGGLILPFAVFGIGIALVMPVMVGLSLGKVAPSHYGSASGVLNTSRQVGGVFGVAVMGAFFASQLATNIPNAINASSDIPPQAKAAVVEQFTGGDIQLQDAVPAPSQTDLSSLPPAQQQAAAAQMQQAQNRVKQVVSEQVAKSLNATFVLAALFPLLAAGLLLFAQRPDVAPRETPAVH